MDCRQGQCAIIEVLTKEACRLSDIHRRLQNVYGDDTLNGAMCTDGRRSLKKGKPALKTIHALGDHQYRTACTPSSGTRWSLIASVWGPLFTCSEGEEDLL